MPLNVTRHSAPKSPSDQRFTRIFRALETGRGGPFGKHDQRAVKTMRDGFMRLRQAGPPLRLAPDVVDRLNRLLREYSKGC